MGWSMHATLDDLPQEGQYVFQVKTGRRIVMTCDIDGEPEVFTFGEGTYLTFAPGEDEAIAASTLNPSLEYLGRHGDQT